MPARRTRRAIQTSRGTLPKNIFTRVTREDEESKWLEMVSEWISTRERRDRRAHVGASESSRMHNRQGRFKDQGASRGKSEKICLVRRLNALSARDTTSVLRLSRSRAKASTVITRRI